MENKQSDFQILIANQSHLDFAQIICDEMAASAQARGTGIAKRSPEYIKDKMREGKAVIAFSKDGIWAGFLLYSKPGAMANTLPIPASSLAPAFQKRGICQGQSKKNPLP